MHAFAELRLDGDHFTPAPALVNQWVMQSILVATAGARSPKPGGLAPGTTTRTIITSAHPHHRLHTLSNCGSMHLQCFIPVT